MDARTQLGDLVNGCALCRHQFDDNVALIVDGDDAALNDAQVVAVLDHLRKQHEGHTRMTFSKVSVLIPTRNRTHLLRALIDSYRRTTTDTHSSELLFRVDNDDEQTRAVLQAEGFRMLVGPRLNGYASLPLFFNELAFVANGDVLMLGNDDIVFVTPGWAQLILEVANCYPDGVFNIGVRTHNEAHFPLSLVSSAVVKRLGFIYDPRIFWGDIYLRDVMGRLQRQHLLPDVEIRHDWAGHAPDQTFIEGEGARRAPGNHMQYHEQAVSEAVEKLRGMLA